MPQHDLEGSGFKLYQLKTNRRTIAGIPHFPEQTSIPHAHNFYEICLFFKARGIHNIDFKTFEIHPNAIHIIAPGRVHLIKAQPECEGYIIAFSTGFYDSFTQHQQGLPKFAFYNAQYSQPILNLDKASCNYLANWLQNLIHDYQTPLKKPPQLFWGHLNLLLWKIHNLYKVNFPQESQQPNNALELYKKFRRLVEDHYAQKHQVQDYANVLFVSAGHLTRVSKSVSGDTASKIIQDRIVLEAKRLLCYSDLTNREIAFKLHFRDPSYFTRLFKKVTKMTPSAFRQYSNNK